MRTDCRRRREHALLAEPPICRACRLRASVSFVFRRLVVFCDDAAQGCKDLDLVKDGLKDDLGALHPPVVLTKVSTRRSPEALNRLKPADLPFLVLVADGKVRAASRAPPAGRYCAPCCGGSLGGNHR